MVYSSLNIRRTNTKYPESYFEVQLERMSLEMEIEYWYSYVSQGLANQIEGHSRADQRLYQRKYCSWVSRYERFQTKHAEHFI